MAALAIAWTPLPQRRSTCVPDTQGGDLPPVQPPADTRCLTVRVTLGKDDFLYERWVDACSTNQVFDDDGCEILSIQ